MAKILVVDDEASLRDILHELLTEAGYTVETAPDGEAAMNRIQKEEFDLVMTDIRMGRMSGIDLIRNLRETGCKSEVVIMTSYASIDTAIEAMKLGAYDYLMKPFENLETVLALVKRATDKARLITENLRLLENLKAKNEELEKLNKAIRELAIRDGLTGLYNRRYFQEMFQAEVARSLRYKRVLCLLMIDVDHFKSYNDQHGHPMGDEVLKGLGRIFAQRPRCTDLVARYGGEEFVILLPETPRDNGIKVANDLRLHVENSPFKKREMQPLGKVTISVGLAEFPADARDATTLLECADKALYTAKSAGRNRVCGFGEPSLTSTGEEKP